MASRIAHIKSLLPEFESALSSFTSSPSKFRIVRTVNPTSTQPKTLYILDSSFNPPSIAHLSLATSAVTRPADSDARPFRLLLLFSTHNADKAPSPASFVQRIALMTAFAEDLSRSLKGPVASSAQIGDSNDPANISIDIGITKEPYYSDKSIAIANTEPLFYPSKPIHVHLVGYDTLIRFCNPKYYQDHNPPLSALRPFFEAGHKLRVTQRPYDPSDKSSAEFGSVDEQQQYLQGLRDGDLEQEGLSKAWAERIDMVEGGEGVGISSTRVRIAAKDGNWGEVGRLCTEEVSAWVQSQRLYEGDASGKKMMS
ncbi:Nucleotidylyl transferase [Lophiostoma macrostomum CBS 122681]|uniref:Nucleotidylyl transferase n=1 Tax=Lophiostoma macrostomum CBS 122681 TaxID=1314788 RepID=A0A6A6T0C6_9PLEO|nr:Nucleotidylyl transferase [Lophiostoma macrostomum CBS 122681]